MKDKLNKNNQSNLQKTLLGTTCAALLRLHSVNLTPSSALWGCVRGASVMAAIGMQMAEVSAGGVDIHSGSSTNISTLTQVVLPLILTVVHLSLIQAQSFQIP